MEKIGEKLLTWLSNNEMKLNADKCHLLLNTPRNNVLKIGNFNTKNLLFKKFPGINFDRTVKFDIHMEYIYHAN